MAWVLFSDAYSTLCTAKKATEVFDKTQTKNIDRRNPCVRLLPVCGEEIVGCFYSFFFFYQWHTTFPGISQQNIKG